MKKLSIALLLLILAAFASACEPASSVEPTATSSIEASPTLPPPPEPTATVETVEGSGPGCTVASAPFPSNPPENSTIPLVSADDWTIGPENAPTTIIEYGDFQ